ncbi:MAG: uroporphyrinogen-III synthase [Saprospiraceae bacterium]
MKTVFITRDLAADSIFKIRLNQTGYEVFGQSLLTFSAVPFLDFPTTAWIFFYSKNGVKFFFENLIQRQIPFPKVAYAAMGKATAKQIAAYNVSPNFVGSGDPEKTATHFLKLALHQKVLFPQALRSRRSIQQLLANQLKSYDLVVYENKVKTELELPTADYLVFTSPLNAVAYHQHNTISATQKIIAIGQSTKKALLDLKLTANIQVAQQASEAALAEAVLIF